MQPEHRSHLGSASMRCMVEIRWPSVGVAAVIRCDHIHAQLQGFRDAPAKSFRAVQGDLLSWIQGLGACRGGLGRCCQEHPRPTAPSRPAALPELDAQPVCAASHAARSAGPVKSSSASAKASSCCSGRAWMRAMVASLKGPQRRLS